DLRRRSATKCACSVDVTDVNQLIERYNEAKKMMTKMAGQFGMGGGARSDTKKKPKGRKGKNGKRKKPKNTNRGGGMPQMAGMPGLGGGMPGGGMTSMEELEKLQEQMGGGTGGGFQCLGNKLPKGMENIAINNHKIDKERPFRF